MQEFFKGYVETRGKKSIMQFKDKGSDELLSLSEAKKLPEYAGVLNDDVILIDVDDYGQSEILMDIVEDLQLDCRVYETTRGKHFYFMNSEELVKKNGNKLKLACGLEADIKVGCKNSYGVIKHNGIDRVIIYDIHIGEKYQELPKFLIPIRTKIDFSKLGEGDGRNQTLFNYILTLQAANFSKDECRECISILNKYILKQPLSERELKVVLRDESFVNVEKSFMDGRTFLFDKFATFIKNQHNVIKINNQLHVYHEGVYVNGWGDIEARMIQHIPGLTAARRTEVLKYLDVLIRENTTATDANFIAFANGVYNLESGRLEPYQPIHIITNKINFNYVSDVYSEIADNVLNKLACGDVEIRMLLDEIIGYCFYRRNELRKAVVLLGDRGNGKSTYLDMIKTLLGDDNTSALDMGELGDKFKTAELFGKLANIGDDIGDEYIPNPAIFKKLVSGDRLNAERKGQDPFDFNNYAKMIFSANTMPRVKDHTFAVLDRLILVPFNAEFSVNDDDFDPYIKYKLRDQNVMEYLIKIGLEGLERVLRNNQFTTGDKIKAEIEEYKRENNPIEVFFNEIEDVLNQSTKDIYNRYREFCLVNNLQSISMIPFCRLACKHFKLTTKQKKIQGVRYQIFVEE